MKKAAIRICDIRKHLNILGNALETVDSLKKRTLGKNLASLLKQTKSLLTACVREIKFFKQHEDQLAANTQRLERIHNILQFRKQDPQTYLYHARDPAIKLTESDISHIYIYEKTAANSR